MELHDFMDLSKLQKIQDEFSDATGLAAVAIGLHGEYLTEGSNFTDFCMKYTRESAEGKRRCEKCDNECMGTYLCHAGLMEFSIDIQVAGEKVGTIVGGQALPNPPDEEKFRQNAQELGINPDEYIAALEKVPVRTEESIRAAAELLGNMVNQLVNLEYLVGSLGQLKDEIVGAQQLTHTINDSTSKLKNIASKQRMLALNASIEAARSGEAGVGFAVVAKNMQDLSSQSAVIYNDIETDTSEITNIISKLAEIFEQQNM